MIIPQSDIRLKIGCHPLKECIIIPCKSANPLLLTIPSPSALIIHSGLAILKHSRIIDFSQKQHASYYYDNNHPSYPELERKAKIGKIYSLKNDGSVYCSGLLCPTLIAGMGKFPDRIPIVKDNHGIRRLTIRECLRFQGFPESFNISCENSIADAYKQIGNSVCVPIVNRIAIEIAKVLEGRCYNE